MRIPGKRLYAHVDHEMETIIQRCWELGLITEFCCQGDHSPYLPTPDSEDLEKNWEAHCSTAYIKFKGEKDLQEFMRRMSPERIVWKGALRHKYDPKGSHAAVQVNGLWWCWEEDHCVVRFPHISIPTVRETLQSL